MNELKRKRDTLCGPNKQSKYIHSMNVEEFISSLQNSSQSVYTKEQVLAIIERVLILKNKHDTPVYIS